MRPLLLAILAGLGSGCTIHRGPGRIPPARALDPAPRSAQMGEVDTLVAALASGDVEPVVARMTPELRKRLGTDALRAAGQTLRQAAGPPRGLIEEHMQREPPLHWYSGLVSHVRVQGEQSWVTPVLYQVAFTPSHQIDRLLVREHWWIEQVEHPAEHYVPITRLHMPANGTWTVAQGGPTAELNAHHGVQSQRFAYDFVLVIDGRFREPGGQGNEAYFGYGQPLLAPAAGTVIRVVDGVPENEPGVRGTAGGNGLVIDHGFGEVSSMWHARPGSLRVAQGDHVEPGQVVAEVGNSGRSTGTHIHLHLTRGDGEISLPAPLVELWVDDRWVEHGVPLKGQRIGAHGSRSSPTTPIARRPRTYLDTARG